MTAGQVGRVWSQDGPAPASGAIGLRGWLLFVALIFHVLEEWPRFPTWATDHFGTTSPRFYVVSHIPIFVIVAWATWRASAWRPSNSALWIFAFLLAGFGTNGLFHLFSSVVLGVLAPGVFTACLVLLPICLYVLQRVAVLLGRSATRRAAVAGGFVSLLVAASLWLDMPTF